MKSYLRFGKFKIKTLYLIIGILLIFIFLLIASTTLKDKHEETNQYKQIISLIKVNNDQVAEIINYDYDDDRVLISLDKYQEALINNIGYCESPPTTPSNSLEDKNVVSQFHLFCLDYKIIANYAFKLSKATNQLLKYSPDNTKNNFSDINEIITYTLTDLEKLRSDTYQDPALDEQISGLKHLQVQIKKISSNPTQTEATKFYKDFENHKINIYSARIYYWNNSVKIDSLSRSIDRLEKLASVSRG